MIFQYFSSNIYCSGTFQENPLNSSTFQACANPNLNLQVHKVEGTRQHFSIIPTQCFYRFFFAILIGPLVKLNGFYTSIKPLRMNI